MDMYLYLFIGLEAKFRSTEVGSSGGGGSRVAPPQPIFLCSLYRGSKEEENSCDSSLNIQGDTEKALLVKMLDQVDFTTSRVFMDFHVWLGWVK